MGRDRYIVRGHEEWLRICARDQGQEFADSTMLGKLFAGTPCLQAMRFLISKLSRLSPDKKVELSLVILDIGVSFV